MMIAMAGTGESADAHGGRRRRTATGDVRCEAGPAGGDGGAGDLDLRRCDCCGSMLVQPLDWELVGRTHWRVLLRCPNCEWTTTGVFDQDAVDRYDRDLERATRKLTRLLARLTKKRMEAEIERFANALETGLIVPFDF
jgi:hypothetical protein